MKTEPTLDPELLSLVEDALSAPDEETEREAVMALHRRGDRATLDAMVALFARTDARARSLAADVIGQLGVPERTLPDDSFAALAHQLPRETEPAVLGDLGVAFGHLRDARAVPLLRPLSDHPDARVRFGVVMGLMGHDTEAALGTLITLSADRDGEVRNWATFALGAQTEEDTPALRAALHARLDDSHLETRSEALSGLAERGDRSIVPRLATALAIEGSLDPLAVEAAARLGEPELHGALVALRGHSALTARFAEVLEDAIARCDPEAEV